MRGVYAGGRSDQGAATVSGPARQGGSEWSPDLVVVGAASRDIAGDDERGWRLGGPAVYCSLTAARLGLRVGSVVGLDRTAAEATELGLLLDAGVHLERVHLERGPIFDNLEVDGRRRQRWLSGSDPISTAMLPDSWRSARGWLLVPVAGEIPDAWADVPPPAASVGVGWQGLLRSFDPDGWVRSVAPTRSPLLDAAGLVAVSMHDLDLDLDLDLAPDQGHASVASQEHDLATDLAADLAAIAEFATGATFVITAGEAGGVAVSQGRPGALRYWAVTSTGTADPTGAGDVFLAALMAAWLTTGELTTPQALRFAAAGGSLAVEAIGLAGAPTKEAVAARLR